MQIDKPQIIDMLKSRGDDDKATQAQSELPDKVDTDKDSGLPDKFGIDPKDLMGKRPAVSAAETSVGAAEPARPVAPRRPSSRCHMWGLPLHGARQPNRPLMSSAESGADSSSPSSITRANKDCLRAFSCITFSSMVPAATSR